MGAMYLSIECRIGNRITYGIAAVDPEDGEKIILCAVADVGDRAAAERLADYCNRVKPDPDRLTEIAAEFVEREA